MLIADQLDNIKAVGLENTKKSTYLCGLIWISLIYR